MPANHSYSHRNRNQITLTAAIILLAGSTVFALSYLPWFGYLRGERNENPYDLVALDKQDAATREKTINQWAEEWKTLPEEQRMDRADQFLNAVVDLMEEKLDLRQSQKVETKGLIKGAAMVATQSGIREDMPPERREKMRELSEKIRGQLESILTPEQRGTFKEMMEERDRRLRPHRPGASPGERP